MALRLGGGAREPGSYQPLSEINVTPLVDVMLVLLIIFMVAAPLMIAGVPVDLPKTSAARLGQVRKPMVVTLGKDGGIFLRDERVEPAVATARLRDIRGSEGDAVVYVRADRSAGYGQVMDVLGKVASAGYARVSLLSQAPAAPAP
ncbi:MAG: ExbD/TolR family protein [Alsobacter sp.]